MEAQNLGYSPAGGRSTRRSPLDRNRDVTDRAWSILWVVLLSLWLAVVIYALATTSDSSGPRSDIEKRIRDVVINSKDTVYNIFDTINPVAFAVGVAITLAFTIGGIVLGFSKPGACCVMGTGALGVMFVYSARSVYDGIIAKVKQISSPGNPDTLFNAGDQFVLTILRMFFILAALFCIHKKKYAHITDIVAKTARTFFRSPSFIAFSLCIYGLIVFILSLSLYVIFSSVNSMPKTLLCLFVMVIPGFYLAYSLQNFGLAVMSLAIATRQWAENHTEFPNTSLLRCAIHVVKYQFGTIAYASTLIGPFISACFAWLRSSKTYVAPTTYSPSSTLDRILEVIIMAFLLMCNTPYTIVFSSMEGRDFAESISKVFLRFKKGGATVYSFVWNFYGIQAAVLIFSTLLFCIIALISLFYADSSKVNITAVMGNIVLCELIIYVIVLPVSLVVDSVGLTSYFYQLETEEDTETKERMSTAPLRGDVYMQTTE